MVRRQAEMADSLSAARKITTQFQEKDQQVRTAARRAGYGGRVPAAALTTPAYCELAFMYQVVELQTLLETVSTERDELHHVIREFESKDEEQVRRRRQAVVARCV